MTRTDLLAIDPTLAAELTRDDARHALAEAAEAELERLEGADWHEIREDPGFRLRCFEEA